MPDLPKPDYFALFGEPRRPWLDPEALKERLRQLSTEAHADRMHDAPAAEKEAANRRHTEINAAHRCLSETKQRLAHLIELETGQPPRRVEAIPTDIADRFIATSELCGESDRLLAREAGARSPILKVELVAATLELGDRLAALANELDGLMKKVEAELRAMNEVWQSTLLFEGAERHQRLPLERLEECYRRVAYLDKCSRQIRERATKLAILGASI